MALTLLHAGPQIDSAPAGSRSLWLRADDLSASLSDTDPVTAWNDRDGNGFNFTQTTGSARPTWNAITTAANDQSTISFDGTDDFLLRSAAIYTGISATVFVVGMSTDGATRQPAFSVGQVLAENDRRTLRWSGDSSNDSIDLDARRGVGVQAATTTYYTVGQFHIGMIQEIELGSRRATIDGGGDGTSSTSMAMLSFDTTYIGSDVRPSSNAFFTGDIAEVIVYLRVISAGDEALTLAYLAARYGITLA
jgi:hypothetical protein